MKKILFSVILCVSVVSVFGQERYAYQYGGPGNGSLKVDIVGYTFDNDAMKLEICWYDPAFDISYYTNPRYNETLLRRVIDTPYSKLGDAVNHKRTMYVNDVPAGAYTFNIRYATDDIDYWRTLGSKAWNVEVVNENNKYICINNITDNE